MGSGAQVLIELGFEFGAMACPCELRLVGPGDVELQRAASAAIAEVRRIEKKYSRYDAASIVSRINAAAGSGESIEVDDETAALLDFAAQLHGASEGRFDITSGVLRRVWNFRQARLPAQHDIAALLPLIGWPMVQWHARRIALPLAGMEIDFGGFGKEYAADRAAQLLHEAGIRHGFVNLGGDIRVIGPRGDSSPWAMGLQHPRAPGQLLGSVAIRDGALATSGDYERYIEVDGQRWCHVFDARSGWPVQHWQCVSVLAPTCAAAGAASTLAMLFGAQGQDFLREQRLSFVARRADGTLVDSGTAPAPNRNTLNE